MLTNNEQNFFQIVGIESIVKDTVYNCIDITVEEDESFVLSNGVVSHNSAMGSILQKRNPKEDGVYALKGKIKNCKNIGDLSDNKEILELMHILGLDPTARNSEIVGYKNIIIATDPDCLHGNTLIDTVDGSKKISEITPGIVVNTSMGEKKILRVTEKEDDSYIELSISGKIIKCTKKHLFPVFRSGEVLLVEAQNIKSTDFILSKKI
jgi:hypothetical protein